MKCGACVSACGNKAHPVRSDLDRVRALLAGDTAVALVLASEYVSALHPMSPHDAESAFEALGFAAVETTALGEELVASAYELVHSRAGCVPSLRSTCPVAVDWVRRFHPEFTMALAPIIPPYVAQARLIRISNPGRDLAIVYASPCYARKDEVYDNEFLGEIDVAIGFDELRALIEEGSGVPSDRITQLRRPRAIKQISGVDGFPFRTLRRNCHSSEVVSVRGLDDLDLLLTAITRGETCPSVIDMLACEGCLDGPCVNDTLSVFMKRHIDVLERERQLPAAVDTREFLASVPAIDLIRSFTPDPAPKRAPTDEEIDRVLCAGEFLSRAETIDCGTCGYDRCIDHAAAISLGDSSWDMCFPLVKKQLDRERDRARQQSVTDDLTGAFTRVAFHTRLSAEASRVTRYGGHLSLVIVDLDGLGPITEAHGSQVADAALRAVGETLRSAIREADSAGRCADDSFGLLLPNTSKVEAWAVAEKIRAAIATLSVKAAGEERVAIRASMGVATFTQKSTSVTETLRGAANAAALARAAGSDRVELAAG